MHKKQKRFPWFIAGAVLYAALSGSGVLYGIIDDQRIRFDAQLQNTREKVDEARAVVLPPNAFDPRPTAVALPPCSADAIPKPIEREADIGPREFGTVAAGELNIRQAAGMSGRIIGQLYRGDQVEIIERITSGPNAGWIRTKGGWVSGKFIERATPTQQLPPQPPCLIPGPWCPTTQGEAS